MKTKPQPPCHCEMEVGVFFINVMIIDKRVQHKYEVEKFNPNAHILFQIFSIKVGKTLKKNDVSQQGLLNA
jgi:hypothetical protein